ncbi:ArsR/SmtB family transcription factor [Haloferula sp. A504]|uniref:ArsR/SmtB family transcription factor n=1 Tax=Haloferula sp. A504 TaxID=3373601 RepID=UPI0031BFBACB|nr:metalloregulator ArsR/SmtB family transcription factor [Verrucomicrobiaceae bacterium E54]
MPRPKLEDFDPQLVRLSAFARALSHPARVAILRFLGQQGESAAMAIVNELPLSQPACSRHLRELVEVGLIKGRTKGSNIFYTLESKALDRFCQSMSKTLHS